MEKTLAQWVPVFLLVCIIFILNSSSALGMDFKWTPRDTSTPSQENSGVTKIRSALISMKGEINPGDAERFRLFMLSHAVDYGRDLPLVLLSSNGGDVVEALKISKIMRAMYAEVWVVDSCASACFFLYLAATHRILTGGASLGVHRAYFNPKYFSSLSPDDAEKKQRELTASVRNILEDNSVSRALIDRMNATSSGEIYWLSEAEIKDLGRNPPWYEELLIARCGYDKSLYNQYSKDGVLNAKLRQNIYDVLECEIPMRKKEIGKLPDLLSSTENFKLK